MKIRTKVIYSIGKFLEAIDKEEADVIIREHEDIDAQTSMPNGKKHCFVVFIQDIAEKAFKNNQLQKFECWDISRSIGRKHCYNVPLNSHHVIEDLKQIFTVEQENKS